MKRFLYIVLAFVATLFTATSCINDEFTTSASDVLTFSADTVAFDTVMTLKGTATKQFIVYNKSKKQVNISSIKVAGNSDARFFLNVDGQKGNEFHDIEIRGNDSIYVFVEGILEKGEKNEPTYVEDNIEFVTNGVKQSVLLTAWGQDVKILRNEEITADTRLTADAPYVVYDTLRVYPGATLTLDPGTTLLFHDKAHMDIGGTLKAIGTSDKPITMRGDRLDKVVGEISFDIMSGQWDGIMIYPGSFGNEMQYVDMRSSTNGLYVLGNDPSKKSLHLLNCMLHNSSSYCMITINANVESEGTEFSDAPTGLVAFVGGTIRAVNCTYANYYLFKAIEGPNIAFFVNDEENSCQPLDCKIINCISYGLGYDVNMGEMDGSNIWVHNTLFKSSGNDDSHFFNCVWKADPKFYTVREDYIFDYRLKNGSDAIARGDRSLCPESARYDRYGNDRFNCASNGLDLGAYVWVPAQDDEQP